MKKIIKRKNSWQKENQLNRLKLMKGNIAAKKKDGININTN